jgi:hypothetical protein
LNGIVIKCGLLREDTRRTVIGFAGRPLASIGSTNIKGLHGLLGYDINGDDIFEGMGDCEPWDQKL